MIDGSGFRSPQTDLGQALRMAWWSYVRRLDTEMEAAGFPKRRASMNYVFALYALPGPMTISQMGRQFDVSRQAASKLVGELRDRGFVQTAASTTDQREKVVKLTPKAIEYVAMRRRAAAALDEAIRERVGPTGADELRKVLDAVGEAAWGKEGFDPVNLYRAPDLW
ncbi:MarR family winged helix-turn-helix transcriptional regulator [Mycobacterium spongiae]|uniref:MarR family transcriptional regulator n=1 Tax=Mycobacterium spongiae TaxID=886343 RepID=A0A975PXX4_9MYCO|nr:MarR family transcriptional regulator [Mycobacterium spongiae]QUR68547.1 MarR family transcriptional regulator [Mycobacterium spongiae]